MPQTCLHALVFETNLKVTSLNFSKNLQPYVVDGPKVKLTKMKQPANIYIFFYLSFDFMTNLIATFYDKKCQENQTHISVSFNLQVESIQAIDKKTVKTNSF